MSGLPFALGLEPVSLILAIPFISALVLVALPGYWLASRLNVLASLATFIAAVVLLFRRPPTTNFLLVDDLSRLFVRLFGRFIGGTDEPEAGGDEAYRPGPPANAADLGRRRVAAE